MSLKRSNSLASIWLQMAARISTRRSFLRVRCSLVLDRRAKISSSFWQTVNRLPEWWIPILSHGTSDSTLWRSHPSSRWVLATMWTSSCWRKFLMRLEVGRRSSPQGGTLTARWKLSTNRWVHGPLARYVKLRVAHAPGMPGTFSPATAD